MPHTVIQYVWYLALLCTTAYALKAGGAPERSTALALLGATASTVLLIRNHHWGSIKTGVLAVDFPLLSFLLWTALSSDRWWSLFAAAFQAIATTAAFLPAIAPTIRPYASYVTLAGWDYLTLGVLVAGTALEGRSNGLRVRV